VHIEAPQAARFTLGQLFTEWNVQLTRSCLGSLGSLCADPATGCSSSSTAHHDPGDPTQLVLPAHQEIAIIYGLTGTEVSQPASYPFPAGCDGDAWAVGRDATLLIAGRAARPASPRCCSACCGRARLQPSAHRIVLTMLTMLTVLIAGHRAGQSGGRDAGRSGRAAPLLRGALPRARSFG